MRHEGFTLIEILVSIAIMGIIMLAVINLQSGTIQTTTNVINSSDRLEDQTLAASYIADRFRGARVVHPVNPLSIGGTTTCDKTSTTNPCFAFVTPETTFGQASGAITRYVYLAYRYEARSGFADRQPDPWADSNGVMIIREYRRVLANLSARCSPLVACTVAEVTAEAATTPSATNGQWASAMLADGFTLANTSGTFSPWTLAAAPLDNRLEIRIRSLYRQNSAARYFPPTGPTTIQVQRRN